jgi:penicillin-insensitive murein endopeptidase
MFRWVLAVPLLALAGCTAVPARDAVSPAPKPPAPAASPAAPPATPRADASAADPTAGATDEETGALDDDLADGEVVARPAPPPSAPILALGAAELEGRYKKDPASLGSMSVGPARAGVLVNGVQMPKGDGWILLDPGHAWGTRETVDALVHCIGRVDQRFPSSPPLPIGHISGKNGGHLSPHLSHQSGRDADVGYYYRPGTPRAFVRATEQNLDLPRTWALVKTALKETSVDMILVDSSIQRLLASYALANGEDPAFVDEVFQVRGKNAQAPIRHVRGHANHLHFRFHNPVAEELGRRLARLLPRAPVVAASSVAEAAGSFAQIRARSGDTLVILARRYGTTVEEIQRVNGLKSNAIRAGVVYRIPQKVAPKAGGRETGRAPVLPAREPPPARPAPARKAHPGKPGH